MMLQSESPFGRSRRRLNASENDLKEMRYECVDRINLAQNRVRSSVLVNTLMTFRVSYIVNNFSTS